MTEVFLNSRFTGEVDDPQKFVSSLVEERRKGNVPFNVNVSYDEDSDTINVECSKGRLVRPLIVVKNGKPVLTDRHIQQLEKGELEWEDLLKQGVIEYVDAAEEENTLIAFFEEELTPEHTHLEIHPLALLGLTTSLVPFGNFSHAVRIAIGGKNQKQAIGFYAANFSVRMDMDVNLLQYPQQPIVSTIMYDIADYAQHPSGQNIVIAVLSYKGYNIEDALIINKGSIERGLGRSVYFRPAIAEELRYAGGLTDEIMIPDKDIKGYKSEVDYRHLEEEGII
ncbi:TPA: DNA-directed RNA polymerase subunit B, partial [Candidatus Woesearchaeota archaeon]|nr:DNA-directed RNA polymerase subunit B [Candidatus Woesearchaeota archaeon]